MPLIPAGPGEHTAQSVPQVPAVIAATGPAGTAAFIDFFRHAAQPEYPSCLCESGGPLHGLDGPRRHRRLTAAAGLAGRPVYRTDVKQRRAPRHRQAGSGRDPADVRFPGRSGERAKPGETD